MHESKNSRIMQRTNAKHNVGAKCGNNVKANADPYASSNRTKFEVTTYTIINLRYQKVMQFNNNVHPQ